MQDFVKTNPVPGSDSLLNEARGLDLLDDTLRRAGITGIRIPERLEVSRDRLRLRAIEATTGNAAQMSHLGEGLAQLHSVDQSAYGLAWDNYIGLSEQPNTSTDDWGRFFADYRLGYRIGKIGSPAVHDRFRAELDRCRASLIDFLNAHCRGPSLVHGDLWSGNVLFDATGAWLIDPAVYYADPDVDLAMTEMFGGFSRVFYDAYDRVRPRGPEYGLKRRIYNLYHYLNHYNLFGSSYLSGCEEGLSALDETLYR